MFKWKDYRRDGRDRHKTMTLDAQEFIRRFLIHVLPSGFHRIRHYGLFASAARAKNIARIRELLAAPNAAEQPRPGAVDADKAEAAEPADQTPLSSCQCPCCGGRMILIEIFARGCAPRSVAPGDFRIDTS